MPAGRIEKFEDLIAWQKARELTKNIYRVTKIGEFLKDFGLRDQMRRASVSISSNISEGDELGSDKQAIRQFYIAKGSSAELYTQIIIADKIGYIQETEKDYLTNECKGISGMLTNLIKSRYSE